MSSTTVIPDAAPTNTITINVSTSTNFQGTLEGDPITGKVRVTDAHPAGTYTITVTAFNPGSLTTTKTFALTVTTPATCPTINFAAPRNFGVGWYTYSVAVGDFNGDGKQDLVAANEFALSQAVPAGLEVLFGSPKYGEIFRTFSPSRLFTPVGSNVTDAFFFVPGTNGAKPAAVTGFGAVFTDVDQPDGENLRTASTVIDYFDRRGKRIFTSSVPASPGDGSLSFFGIIFNDARIAVVRITTGDVAPGPNDDRQHDIVMMDDFIYGEPQVLVGFAAQN